MEEKRTLGPETVCENCGRTYGYRYRVRSLPDNLFWVTWETGTCDICKKTEIPVTHIRVFGWITWNNVADRKEEIERERKLYGH